MSEDDQAGPGRHEDDQVSRVEGMAPPGRPRVPRSPWWRVGAAVVAVGALTWAASTVEGTLRLGGAAQADPARATAGPEAAAFVQAALLACPGPVPSVGAAEEGAPTVEVVASGAPRSVTATAGVTAPAPVPTGGASVLRTTDEQGRPVELRPDRPVRVAVEEPASAVVEATGGLAPAVAGGQLSLATDPGSRGLSLTGCVAPAESQWLVGGGSAPGRSEQLVLTNPGPDAVTVEVSVLGAGGPVETTGAGSIVVPGGGRVVELLDGLARGAQAPVLTVTATGGPVVAHLAESFREGTTDRGTEVVPPVAAPATDLVVPALPAAPRGHEREVVLRLAAPGEVPAVVDVTALTAQGAVRLTDLVTRVRAGHTLDVPLDNLPDGVTALRLRSDQPVTAGARLEVLPAKGKPQVVQEGEADEASATAEPDPDGTEPGPDATEQGEPLLRAAGDVAWVGATVPSSTPTGMALPDRGTVPRAAARLALTAVDGTEATVTWVDEAGRESVQQVTLPNDTTVALDVPATARAVWVAAPGHAGVASAVHVSGADERGPFVASATVPQLPWLRQVTQVRPVVP